MNMRWKSGIIFGVFIFPGARTLTYYVLSFCSLQQSSKSHRWCNFSWNVFSFTSTPIQNMKFEIVVICSWLFLIIHSCGCETFCFVSAPPQIMQKLNLSKRKRSKSKTGSWIAVQFSVFIAPAAGEGTSHVCFPSNASRYLNSVCNK